MDEKIKAMDDKLDRLLDAVLGNGHEGLLIRVDRIEQKEERRGDLTIRLDRVERDSSRLRKIIWGIGSALLVAVLTALASFFIK